MEDEIKGNCPDCNCNNWLGELDPNGMAFCTECFDRVVPVKAGYLWKRRALDQEFEVRQ